MKPTVPSSSIDRRILLSTLALLPALSTLMPVSAPAQTPGGPLPSWNDGRGEEGDPRLRARHHRQAEPNYVPPEERIATFDQDGTLWVEQPMYTPVVYCLDRVPAVVAKKPELKDVEPFKTVLSGDREAIAKLPMHDSRRSWSRRSPA